MSDEPFVSYPVRDVLERIERKLDTVTTSLVQRLDNHDGRLANVERQLAERVANRMRLADWVKWTVGVAVVLVAAFVGGQVHL